MRLESGDIAPNPAPLRENKQLLDTPNVRNLWQKTTNNAFAPRALM